MNDRHPLETLLIKGTEMWAIRISNLSDLDLQKTFDGLLPLKPKILLVSQEGEEKHTHHHIIITTQNLLKEIDTVTTRNRKVRELLNKTCKQIYPGIKGNKNLYISPAKKKMQLLKYTLKEGTYISHGLSGAIIQDLCKVSAPKTNLKEKFTQLDEQLLLKQITFTQYSERYVETKVSHDQPLYNNHLQAFLTTKAIKCGELKVDNYVGRILEKIFL